VGVASGVDGGVAGTGADGQRTDPVGGDALQRAREAGRGGDVGALLLGILDVADRALALAVAGEVERQRGDSFGGEPSGVPAGHLFLHGRPGPGHDHHAPGVGVVDGAVEVPDEGVLG